MRLVVGSSKGEALQKEKLFRRRSSSGGEALQEEKLFRRRSSSGGEALQREEPGDAKEGGGAGKWTPDV